MITNAIPKFLIPASPVITSRVQPNTAAAKPSIMRRAGTPTAITVKIPFSEFITFPSRKVYCKLLNRATT